MRSELEGRPRGMDLGGAGSDGTVPPIARDLIRAFKVAMRTIRFHDAGNEAAQSALDAFAGLATDLFRLSGPFSLQVLGDYLFWNDTRLKPDASSLALYDSVGREFSGRGIGSLTVRAAVDRRAAHLLATELNAVPVCHPDSDMEPAPDAWQKLNERLTELAPAFEVGPPRAWDDVANSRVPVDSKEKAKRAFFRAVAVTRAIMSGSRLGHDLDLRRAKRAVQSMVDMILEEEFSLIGLTTIRQYDSYTFFHCVNVCVLSIALGKRLGMNRQQLSELGVSALFHDIGKTEIPTEVLRKPDKFSPEEWDLMKRHPALGVRVLLQLRGMSDLANKAMIVAFEHHLGFDGRGYPTLWRPRDLHVFSRIVAVADAFDAMTTRRVYQRSPFARDAALGHMIRNSGRAFDPIVLKEFINLVGVFPVGSLVRLSDDRLAVVLAAGDAGSALRPRIRVLRAPDGTPVTGTDLDLSSPECSDLEIREGLDPELLGIDPSPAFL